MLKKYPDVKIVGNGVELFGDMDGIKQYDDFFRLQKRFFLNRTFPCNIFHSLLRENFIPTFSGVTIRLDILKTCNFNYSYQPWTDRSIYLQICWKNSFLYLPEILTRWRIHRQSYISQENQNYRRNRFQRLYELMSLALPHNPVLRIFYFAEMSIFQLLRAVTRRIKR